MKDEAKCDLLAGEAVAFARNGLWLCVKQCAQEIRDINSDYMYMLAERHKALYWLLVSAEWGSYKDAKKCFKKIVDTSE